MPYYRKKPVVIEAIQYDGTNEDDIHEFVGADLAYTRGDELFVASLEGNMRISLNDYVICGVQGEFYPCKPDIFESTYEKVEDGDS